MSSPPDADANADPAGAGGSPVVDSTVINSPVVDSPGINSPFGGTPAPPPAVAGAPPGEFGVMLRLALGLFTIGFAVWLIFRWSDYRKHYTLATENLHRGSSSFIELTLVREDRANLDCASDVDLAGLHCAFGADERPHPAAGDEVHVLRPYNTTGGELLLGAGLWSSPGMRGTLPGKRFTVFCDFDVAGAVRRVALRWAPGGKFGPVEKSVITGSLHDCAIPE